MVAQTDAPGAMDEERVPVPLTPEVLPAGVGAGPRGARDPLAVYLAGLGPCSSAAWQRGFEHAAYLEALVRAADAAMDAAAQLGASAPEDTGR